MCYLPDPYWFKLLLVVTPVIAAFLGVVLTNRNNRKIQDAALAHEKKERQLETKRSAAQEIFTLMESWAADMRISGIVAAGAVGRGVPLPLNDRRMLLDSARYLRAHMLVAVHFPHLEPNWRAPLIEQEKIMRIGMMNVDGTDADAKKEAVIDAVNSLTMKTIDLLNAVTADLVKLHS
jgi:hypothetical protein